MSLEPDETRKDLEHRHADDSGSLGDVSHIQAQIDADFELLGNIVTDPGNLPGGASPRGMGIWTDPKAAQVWLDDGGSLLHYDSNGQPIPVSFVHFLRFTDADTGEVYYEVYIEEDS